MPVAVEEGRGMLHIEVLKLQHCVRVAPHQRLDQLIHDLKPGQTCVSSCGEEYCF